MLENLSRERAPRNRTTTLSPEEVAFYQCRIVKLPAGIVGVREVENKVINDDVFEILDRLPDGFVDLLFLDPPYNLTKSFNSLTFRQRTVEAYTCWFESWFVRLLRMLKPTSSVYICGDWRCSAAVHLVAEKHLVVRNRITWEREKGRGARTNWKNCSEDIWFCTVSDKYTFNVDAVKLRRRVIAPYIDADGKPKDWERTEDGDYRLTHPSNIWTDLTVPFWSMPENTDHPTQKPEKLLAKMILASSDPGDLVFDPFLGSGTSAVVAQKLKRRFIGVELDPTYSCLAAKRLGIAERDKTIQGYSEGVFWERNSLQDRKNSEKDRNAGGALPLFERNTEMGRK